MITKQEAMDLDIGQVIYHGKNRDSKNYPQKWRVNGKTQTWKTRPNDFKVPLKHGMYDWWYLQPSNVEDFHHSRNCPFEK